MNADQTLSFNRWIRAAVAAAILQGVAGCSLFSSGEGAASGQWSDQMGQAMRAGPAESAIAAPHKKEPFWEKYRDKRVNQINQNLNVEEPAGW